MLAGRVAPGGLYGARIVTVRRLGGARLRRAARGRAGVVGLAVALYLGAGLLATSPAVFETDRLLGYGVPREGRVTPGDHLQTAYNLWLPGHQLGRAAAPWLDPYSFQPEVEPRVNFAGWPFAAVYGPLQAVFGTVTGWNLFVLLTYVGAGGFAALWLRAFGLPLGAALIGGLAFGLAPYRVAQSTGHLLGPISMLLPLALYGVERRKTWLAAAALASIPLSGQVHLALGAIPFVLAYALARRQPRLGAVAAAAGVIGGAVVWALSLRDTVERPFSEVERYSATLGDFLTRDPGEFERFVYLGWLLPVAAIAGVGCLCSKRKLRFAPARGRARARRARSVPARARVEPARLRLALAEYAVAFDTCARSGCCRSPASAWLPSPPLQSLVFQKHKVLRGRGSSRWSRRSVVVADLWVPLYDPLVADEGNAVYQRVKAAPPGRLLELPVLRPDDYAGSVSSTTRCRRRASGRSATRPRRRRRPSAPLPCWRKPGDRRALLRRLDVRILVSYLDGRPVGYNSVPR